MNEQFRIVIVSSRFSFSLSLKFEKRKHVPHPRCRYLEVRYHRPEEIHKGRLIESRVENIVVFLPDIASSCMPTSLEWDQTTAAYKQKCAEELAEELNEAQTTVHKCFSSFFVVVSSLDLLDLMKFGIYECFFSFQDEDMEARSASHHSAIDIENLRVCCQLNLHFENELIEI